MTIQTLISFNKYDLKLFMVNISQIYSLFASINWLFLFVSFDSVLPRSLSKKQIHRHTNRTLWVIRYKLIVCWTADEHKKKYTSQELLAIFFLYLHNKKKLRFFFLKQINSFMVSATRDRRLCVAVFVMNSSTFLFLDIFFFVSRLKQYWILLHFHSTFPKRNLVYRILRWNSWMYVYVLLVSVMF